MIYPDIMVIFHQRPTNQPAWVQTFLPDGPSGSPLRCLLGSAAAPTRGWEQGGVRWGCNQQKGGSRDIILGYWAMGYIYIYHICNMYMYIYWIYIICVYNDSIYIYIYTLISDKRVRGTVWKQHHRGFCWFHSFPQFGDNFTNRKDSHEVKGFINQQQHPTTALIKSYHYICSTCIPSILDFSPQFQFGLRVDEAQGNPTNRWFRSSMGEFSSHVGQFD